MEGPKFEKLEDSSKEGVKTEKQQRVEDLASVFC